MLPICHCGDAWLQEVFWAKHAVVAMPVLARLLHEIGNAVESKAGRAEYRSNPTLYPYAIIFGYVSRERRANTQNPLQKTIATVLSSDNNPAFPTCPLTAGTSGRRSGILRRV